VAATVGHLTYQAQQSSAASSIVTPVTPPVKKDLIVPSSTAGAG
jgi:hypothetical protein